MAQWNVTLRTNGNSKNNAKKARQKAIAEPRTSRGHTSSSLVCVKNPLLLHRMAARTTSAMPVVVVRRFDLGSNEALFVAIDKVNRS